MSAHFQTRPPTRRKSGFALVIAVSLLALLVLALVSLATLTRLETQVGMNSRKQAQARQNARFALAQAFGQLQLHAGPDTRVTATAETVGGTGANSHWTGVWDSSGGAERTWLVSGNEVGEILYDPTVVVSLPSAPSAVSPGVQLGTREARLLVGPKTVGASDTNAFVLAPLVNLEGPVSGEANDQVVGRYAWWVGDEGVKARVNVADRRDQIPYPDLAIRERTAQLALPRPRIEPVLGVEYQANEPRIERVIQENQLAYLPVHPDLGTIRDQFHAFTTYSSGVLADAEAGGLKHDLSNPDASVSLAMRHFLGARPNSASTDTVPEYDVHALEVDSGATPNAFSIGPVVVGFWIYLSIPSPSGSGSAVQVTWQSHLDIWNPYHARISASNVRFMLEGAPTISIEGTSSEGGEVLTQIDLLHTVDWDNRMMLQTSDMSPDYAEPGLVSSFSIPAAPQAVDARGAGGSVVHVNGDPPYQVRMTFPSGTPTVLSLSMGGDRVASYSLPQPAPSSTNTQAIAAIAFRLRADPAGDWLRNCDPRGRVVAAPGTMGFSPYDSDPQWNSRLFNGFAWSAPAYPPNATIRPGVAERPFFDLPRQEGVSVGSLQHFGWGQSDAGDNLGAFRTGNPWGSFQSGMRLGREADANAVFDSSYFSTISATWDASTSTPLPNQHLAIWNPEAVPLQLSDLVDPAVGDRKPAAHLLLRGAFNVNSCSASAWRALTEGTEIVSWNYHNGNERERDLHRAFFRLPHTAQLVGDPFTAEDTWNLGVRELTAEQSDQLANEIAERIPLAYVNVGKAAGRPFTSLRQFVGSGLLQDAIDAAGLNAGRVALSPGWLSQAELMNAWAPLLSVRSDTFRIRAYGEAINPITEEIEARAWCEAIVQRIPKYVVPDLTEDAEPDDGDVPWQTPVNATNQTFGRRFVITSFRWLSPDDI